MSTSLAPSPSRAAASSTSGTPYSITISMSQATVTALTASGYQLCGFKAVSSPTPGQPLVWFSTNQFATQLTINWEEFYLAYTSTSEIESGVVITASDNFPIDLGQLLTINQPGGGGMLGAGTDPNGIQILNGDQVVYTVGMGQMLGNQLTPMCAFSAYPGFMLDIEPIEKVVLMFSTLPLNTGSVIEQAFSPGILLDLTDQHDAVVTFNMTPAPGVADWSGANCSNSPIPAQAEMAQILINPAGIKLNSQKQRR